MKQSKQIGSGIRLRIRHMKPFLQPTVGTAPFSGSISIVTANGEH